MRHSQIRVYYKCCIVSAPIECSRDSYEFLIKIWDKQLINLQEQVYALFLNSSNEVISWRCLNTGTGNGTDFDLKLALACSIGCMASKIIIAHNHPSGQLKPSFRDMQITDKLVQASALLDIELTDHIIIGPEGYYSFVDNGEIKV